MDLEQEYPIPESFSIVESIRCDPQMLREDNVQVVGQFHDKFIWCRLRKPSVLLCFDQHAVHERIRYDRLLKVSIDANDGHRLASRTFRPPYRMKVAACRQELIEHGGHLLEDIFSLGVQLLPSQSTPTRSIKVAITRVPNALIDFDNEAIFGDYFDEIASYFEIIDGKVQTKEPVERIKPLTNVLVNQLRTQACHGAIRFGDPLTRPAMKEMIKTLGSCRMPFRCAHGRFLLMSALSIPNHPSMPNELEDVEVDVVDKYEFDSFE